jgi:hypothetical protein
VYLEWTPPAPSSLHGEFLGYLLSYRPRDASPAQAEERRLPDPTLKVRKIQLPRNTYTYSISTSNK